MDACAFAGCRNERRSSSQPLCGPHYHQQLKGNPLKPLRRAPQPLQPEVLRDGRWLRICDVDGCEVEAPASSRHCNKHRFRIYRHGDPHKVITPDQVHRPSGPEHYLWTEDPGYDAMHRRVWRARGSASQFACPCGEPAKHWAFVGERDPQDRQPVGRSVDDYQAMCVRCHKVMDNKAMGINRVSS